MYKIFSCLLISGLLLSLVNLSAQNITIDRSVIGAGGMVGAVNSDNITMSGITGQTAIEKLPGTTPVFNNMLVDVYQGFWVPTGNYFTGVDDYSQNTGIKVENFPNPFSSSTVVKYNLPGSGFVSIKIYDVVGNTVKLLWNGYQNSGNQALTWNGKDDNSEPLASGSYMYELVYTPSSGSDLTGNTIRLRNIMIIVK